MINYKACIRKLSFDFKKCKSEADQEDYGVPKHVPTNDDIGKCYQLTLTLLALLCNSWFGLL